jgi:small subunit ribosomal protein S14
MAGKGIIQREQKRRRLIHKFRIKREDLKYQFHAAKRAGGVSAEKEINAKKQLIMHKLASLPKNSLPVRKSNRCWITGRSRAVYRDFGLSRHVIREMAYEGLIPGLKKSSW